MCSQCRSNLMLICLALLSLLLYGAFVASPIDDLGVDIGVGIMFGAGTVGTIWLTVSHALDPSPRAHPNHHGYH
ncbi:MAG: hypothetical protein JWN38_909 [Candidatus Saccharibacteria bacterium]|nr:hypothetical protein [Candidatus Saccharibacteria bacterium]